MATLVNTKIKLNEPVKNKTFGYFITVDKKNINYLTVKAVDYKGRGKGSVGIIKRNGVAEIKPKYADKINPLIEASPMQVKINLTLDLVYGKERTAFAKVVKNGMTKFNHSISQIMRPKNYSALGGR